MGKTAVDGILFDLDNTLLDRESVFLRVAENFYDEHLANTADIARAEAVAMLVDWEADGYVAREGGAVEVAGRVALHRPRHAVGNWVVPRRDAEAR